MRFLIFQFLLTFCFMALVKSSYYVNSNNTNGLGDGSKENPFSSLEEAIGYIGETQDGEIIIMGESISITSMIQFPVSSKYYVRGSPNTTNGFVTFIFEQGAYLSVSYFSSLTLENIQFAMRDPTAFFSQSFLVINYRTKVTLNRILIQDLHFSWETEIISILNMGEVTIIDSEFINLTNVKINSYLSSLTVTGCRFVNIVLSSDSIYNQFSLFTDSDGDKFTFKNNTFEGGRLNNSRIFGVVKAKVLFSDFIVKDLVLTSGDSFFALGLYGGSISADIQNGVFQNITEEALRSQIDETNYPGLIINQKNSRLNFKNIELRNLFLYSISFISCDQIKIIIEAPIIRAQEGPNKITLRDISIKDSTNAFINTSDHNVEIQNMLLLNSSYNGNSIQTVESRGAVYPTIFSINAYSVLIQNVTGRDTHSPFLKVSNVETVEIYDCDFINATTSLDFDAENQHFVHITKTTSRSSENTLGVIGIRNFNVYNYTYIQGPDDKTEILFASLLHIGGRFANLNIDDSKWTNIDTASIYAEYLDKIQISNLTVSADLAFPSKKVPKKRVFQFLVLGEMSFVNSQVLNNQNANILTLSNPPNADSFKLNNSKILFENMKVGNNNATFHSTTGILPALFDFYGLLNSLVFICQNSVFENNKIANSIFSVQDSSALEITLLRNIFRDNYSKGSGVIYSSKLMTKNLSKLELTDNRFIDNGCDGNGGLFSLISSKCEFVAFDNIYSNISAKRFGGVGYVSSTDLTYSEKNGSYTNVFANSSGGCWYFSTLPRDNKADQLKFADTTFRKAHVSEDGGAIYLAQGGLDLKNCFFQENKAAIAGGDIYVRKLSSINVENTIFTQSSALKGAWIYGEDIVGETFTFKKIKVNNISSTENNPLLLSLNLGTLIIIDSEFENIFISLFSSISSIISFQNVKLNNIFCGNLGQAFCLFKGSPMRLSISDTKITNVTSNFDLLNVGSQEETIFHNVEFVDIKTSKGYDSSELPFILKITTANHINIQHSKFLNTGFSVIKVTNSFVEITDTIFSNSDSNFRILQQSGQTQEGSGSMIFLLAESSNSSIINSTFSNNFNHSSAYTRGAIKIIGDKGSHLIRQSTFQGNRALSGAAIAFGDGIYNTEISNSKFSENQVTLSGGCISFADSSPQSNLTINNSSFINNQAQQGGCIFIGSQNTLIQNSNFTKNNADKGGAIASFVSDNALSKIIVNKNVFTENSASIGSALMAFGRMNFYITDAIFSNNKAEFGGDIASQPDILRMQVYEVDEAFLFLRRITPEILLGRSSTTLVLDSIRLNSNISLKHKTGRSPNYLFIFTLLDKFMQKSQVTDPSSLLTISIKDSTNEKNVKPSLLGQTTYDFQKSSGSIFIWKSFSLRGDINTSITLSAQTSVTDLRTNQVKLLPSVEWKAKIVPCSQGEIYDAANVICSPCLEGTFSYEDPYKAESCQKCQGHLICKGSNVVYPQKGYWQMDRGVENVIQCFAEEACLGGESYDGTDYSFSGFCGEGYQGMACGTCRPGYAKFGNSQECIDCKNDEGYFKKFSAFLLIQIFGTAVIIKIYFPKKPLNDIQKKFIGIKITITKIVIDFIHILNLSYGFSLNWPKPIDIFLYVLTKLIPDSTDSLSIDCLIALSNENNDKIFFIKLLVLILQPLVFILAAVGILGASYKIRGKKSQQNNDLMTDIRAVSALIIYILQPYVIKATFQLFKCQNFGSISSPQYYLIEDTSIKCWGFEHLNWVLGIGITSLTVWLIFPVFALILMTKHNSKFSKENFPNRYGWIFFEYDPSLAYWEVFTLAVKVILIVLITFIRDAYLQIYFGFMSLTVFLYFEVKINPLKNLGGNLAQQISCLVLICIFYNALFFVPILKNFQASNDSNTIKDILISLNFVVATIFLAYCVYLVFRTFKEKFNDRTKSLKELNLFSITSQEMNNQEDLKPIFNRNGETIQDLKPSASLPLRVIQNIEANTSAKKRHLSLISEDNPGRPLFSPTEIKQFSLFQNGVESKEHKKMKKKDCLEGAGDINNSRFFSDIELSFEEKPCHDNPMIKARDKSRLVKDEKDLQIIEPENIDDSLIFPDGKISFEEKEPRDKILMKAITRSISKNMKKIKKGGLEDVGDSIIFPDVQMSFEEKGPKDKKSMRIISKSITKKGIGEKEQEIEDILDADLKGLENRKREMDQKETLEPKIELLADSNQEKQSSV